MFYHDRRIKLFSFKALKQKLVCGQTSKTELLNRKRGVSERSKLKAIFLIRGGEIVKLGENAIINIQRIMKGVPAEVTVQIAHSFEKSKNSPKYN